MPLNLINSTWTSSFSSSRQTPIKPSPLTTRAVPLERKLINQAINLHRINASHEILMMLIKNKAIKANKHRTSHPFVPKEEFQLISLRFGAAADGTRRMMKIFWSFCCEKIFSWWCLGCSVDVAEVLWFASVLKSDYVSMLRVVYWSCKKLRRQRRHKICFINSISASSMLGTPPYPASPFSILKIRLAR